jgi:hypothetical protein
MSLLPKHASWCTPLLLVVAEAMDEYRENVYDVLLTPGRSYPIIDVAEDSMILGLDDEYPVLFFVCLDEPGDWNRFHFTIKPLPWPEAVAGWVPINPSSN